MLQLKGNLRVGLNTSSISVRLKVESELADGSNSNWTSHARLLSFDVPVVRKTEIQLSLLVQFAPSSRVSPFAEDIREQTPFWR